MNIKKNRLLDFMSKRKIRQQLSVIYIVAVVLPITIIGSFLLGNTGHLLTNYYKNLLESDNLRVKTILFEITTQVYNMSENISFEDSLQDILAADAGSPPAQNAYVYTTIDNYVSTHAEIDNITVYTDNPFAAECMHFALAGEEIKSTAWYQRAMLQAGAFWIPMERYDKYGNSYWNLALVRRITVMSGGHEAVLVITISDNYLQTRIGSNEYEISASTEDGTIVYDSTRKHYGEKQRIDINYQDNYYEYLGPVWYGVKSYFTKLATLNLYQTNSRVYVVTMHASAYRDILSILMTCLLIIMAAVMMPWILIHYFTRYFTNRVTVLRNEMKKASNEEEILAQSFGGEDELSEIYADLQVMVHKIKEKDAKMYEARLSEQQLLNEQQVMEMKMLASQINPHFLYNTLESIRMQALTAGNREVANSIKLLGKSMRYVLENTGTAMVTLKKELDYMETYLQIQRIRFGSRFNYEIHMQEGFDPNHYMIQPILLQPIVENAILHGMEQVEENGLISVSMEAIPAERMSTDKTSRGTTDASEADGRLKICISDNGCGMTEEELETLQIKISQKTLNRKSSIGLCNINQRIRLCHGEEYGMKIDSTLGKGTAITVILPIVSPE